MEFKVKQRKHPNVPKFPGDDFKLAQKFSDNIMREFGMFIKAVVLFGSTARPSAHEKIYEPDIDVLIIIDDLTVIMSPEVVETYRIITEKTAARASKRLHITTMKLTSFWEYMRNGDPVAVNMLRDGVPLHDVGIFAPMQMLLFQGRIKPSKESIWTYYARAPATMANANWHILQATLDLYWAVIDAAHSALMKMGEVPPTPSHVADLIHKKLVKTGLVSKKHVDTMHFFYDLSKKITHRQLADIPGKKYDEYRLRADEFIKAMKKVIERR